MFVKNEPIMKIGSTLVATDLHIGITTELFKLGFKMPLQGEAFASRLNKIGRRTRAHSLALLGDVKHSLDAREFERKELSQFMDSLEFDDVIIIKGNHDGMIEEMTDKNVVPFLEIEDYFLTHGHRKVGKTKTNNIVIGHNHPVIMFRDKLNAVYRERAWIIGQGKGSLKDKKIIWMPAFNELCGGADVNTGEKGLGPIARELDIKKAHAHLLDGTDLGEIGKLAAKRLARHGRR